MMRLRLGCCLVLDLPQPTPAIFRLNVHPERGHDLEVADWLQTSPQVPLECFIDGYGTACVRLSAPAGRSTAWTDGVIRDACLPDPENRFASEVPVSELPVETLPFLLPSRFCESDLLSEAAWGLFGGIWPGWNRVQVICNHVHLDTAFGYQFASVSRTAAETHAERRGVCRDYAHLAIAFWRALNIPAAIAPATSAISDNRHPTRRWILPRGSKSISAAAGGPSTPATTTAARVAC